MCIAGRGARPTVSRCYWRMQLRIPQGEEPSRSRTGAMLRLAVGFPSRYVSAVAFAVRVPNISMCSSNLSAKELRIPRDVLSVLSRHIILVIDRLRRALGHTRAAVDALIRIDE